MICCLSDWQNVFSDARRIYSTSARHTPDLRRLWLDQPADTGDLSGDFWNRGRNPLRKAEQTLYLCLWVYPVAYTPKKLNSLIIRQCSTGSIHPRWHAAKDLPPFSPRPQPLHPLILSFSASFCILSTWCWNMNHSPDPIKWHKFLINLIQRLEKNRLNALYDNTGVCWPQPAISSSHQCLSSLHPT